MPPASTPHGAQPLESGAAAGRHLDDAACLDARGRAEVVLQSGGKLSGHDGGTGRELWAYTGKELAKIASPVAGPGVVLAATRDELLAVRPARKRLAPRPWRGGAPLRPSTATPLVHEGCVYSVNSAGLLTCGEAASGKEVWRKRVAGPFSASPVVADGKLYLVGERGVTTVIQLGKTPEVLARDDLGETLLASPALAEAPVPASRPTPFLHRPEEQEAAPHGIGQAVWRLTCQSRALTPAGG